MGYEENVGWQVQRLGFQSLLCLKVCKILGKSDSSKPVFSFIYKNDLVEGDFIFLNLK